jgi:D-alanyl-D-alanine carboxypeptidase
MRNLLAENLDKAATRRTVAAIGERSPADANTDVAQDEMPSRSAPPMHVASAAPEPLAAEVTRPAASAPRYLTPTPITPQQKPEPGPLSSGVLQTQPISAIPGSSEPMKPVRVKTVQVKAGPIKLASAGPAQSAPMINTVQSSRNDVPETSGSIIAKSDRADINKPNMPPQPLNHGTGQGILGVLPASSLQAAPSQAMAYADTSPRSQPQPQTPSQPQAAQQNGPVKPATLHTGWIIQVGALESEAEARQRLDAARQKASGLLGKADPFTETVVSKGDKTLYRARFAGLERDQAEAVCKALKRSEISCITIKN